MKIRGNTLLTINIALSEIIIVYISEKGEYDKKVNYISRISQGGALSIVKLIKERTPCKASYRKV